MVSAFLKLTENISGKVAIYMVYSYKAASPPMHSFITHCPLLQLVTDLFIINRSRPGNKGRDTFSRWPQKKCIYALQSSLVLFHCYTSVSYHENVVNVYRESRQYEIQEMKAVLDFTHFHSVDRSDMVFRYWAGNSRLRGDAVDETKDKFQ